MFADISICPLSFIVLLKGDYEADDDDDDGKATSDIMDRVTFVCSTPFATTRNVTKFCSSVASCELDPVRALVIVQIVDLKLTCANVPDVDIVRLPRPPRLVIPIVLSFCLLRLLNENGRAAL